jgi:hypothetical protein
MMAELRRKAGRDLIFMQNKILCKRAKTIERHETGVKPKRDRPERRASRRRLYTRSCIPGSSDAVKHFTAQPNPRRHSARKPQPRLEAGNPQRPMTARLVRRSRTISVIAIPMASAYGPRGHFGFQPVRTGANQRARVRFNRWSKRWLTAPRAARVPEPSSDRSARVRAAIVGPERTWRIGQDLRHPPHL